MADRVRADGTDEPASLAEAHELVRRQRPSRDAKPLVWAAFHRRNAEVYAMVALLDPVERREARAHVAQELRFARDIEDELEAKGELGE